MKFEKWNIAARAPAAERVLQASGIPPLAAAVLGTRGICTAEQAEAFLDDGVHLLQDPFALQDMAPAVERIQTAIATGEKIAVYGDYDVDGITATCLLVRFLWQVEANCTYYIPDRLEEGYGLNQAAISFLAEEGVALLITVDCGITAVEEVAYAKSLGIDVVITDHHECKEILPEAVAVINPNRKDCSYPFPYLAGVGVALKLALALTPEKQKDIVFQQFAPLAAVGTVADVMPLVGENRAVLQQGLREIRYGLAPFRTAARRGGLYTLIRETGLDKRWIDSTSIGFALAPRLNAAGRMGCARLAAELLLTEDWKRADDLAKQLCNLNRERQAIEGHIYEQAVLRIETMPPQDRMALVLEDADWHQGVVGIVASRLADKYARPVFMICLDGEKGKGSCRSFGDFNLFEVLEANADLLDSFGGHALAAGFTISKQNISAFRQRMNACACRHWDGEKPVSQLFIDVELFNPDILTIEQIQALSILEPHGSGNPKPLFCMRGMTILSLSHVGDGRHLKLRLKKKNQQLDAIFFSATAREMGVQMGDRVDAAFTLQINEFRGNQTVQLVLVDLRPGCTQAQIQKELYEKYKNGLPLTQEEARAITPNREEFAAVWRYLAKRAGPQGLEDTLLNLSRKIAKSFGLRAAATRIMVCLEVFAERGLILLQGDCSHLQISLCKGAGKVDLEQSPIMLVLRSSSQP
ncbi:MAG: single-stranded-DNA-specific exonuclease RecJ [Oscillospiraceae bacterium]|nr:single-stranded-DNA-specific exonuclease RecJ [Oscillospiraceae bacterium]